MNSKKNILVLILSTIAVFVLLIIVWQISQSKNIIPGITTNTGGGEMRNNNQNDNIWATSTGIGGLSIYSSKKYEVKFSGPTNWHIGGNDLNYDHFQLFNYDESVAGKDFSSESVDNKIAVGISDSNTYGTSTDYPEKVRKEKTVVIAGQQGNIVDVELMGGQKIRTYFIPLHTDSGKFLAMSIYGNQLNFYVLDEIVRSLQFTALK